MAACSMASTLAVERAWMGVLRGSKRVEGAVGKCELLT
jgi:hypothetical protein